MSEKRRLSIGITVNLENYENLKVEVEGEAENDQDAGELIEYLDNVLSRLGRADPETKKRIDSYRCRVLAQPGEILSVDEKAPEYSVENPRPEKEARPKDADIPVKEKHEAPPEEIPVKEEPETPKPDTPVKEEHENPNAGTGYTCSACGKPISKAEEQLSQIFMGRSLCKKCLEKMQN